MNQIDLCKSQLATVSKVNHEKVNAFIEAFPKAIAISLEKSKEVNCALFKASISNKGVKLLPHGHMRTPILLGNVRPTSVFIESISQIASLTPDDVSHLTETIVNIAKLALSKGDGSHFIIPNVCRIYVDKGRIRVTSSVKAEVADDRH